VSEKMAISSASAPLGNESFLSQDEEMRLIEMARKEIMQLDSDGDVSVLLAEDGRTFIGWGSKKQTPFHEAEHSEVAVFRSITPRVENQGLKFIFIATCTTEETIKPPCQNCKKILRMYAPGIVALRASTKTADIARHVLS
jgi:hypothetical protein